ncbi:MAG: glucose-6-phosphate isomerase [Planctomycetes bacterium]|nr:glucose-6-phosphate isomerase [Planctomycetota bacterium]
MPKREIKLYYNNVMADVIGSEHGITPEQLKDLAEKTSPLIPLLNIERQGGATPYRDLPYKSDISQQVKKLVKELAPRCENLVVLGIGGSALGNIALQTALNPYMYNLDEKQRTGPRLFVFDNVDPAQLVSFLDWLQDKLDKTIFNVISKSGRTSETAAQFMIIRQLLLDKLGPDGLKDQVVATTDSSQGTLRKIADDADLRCLEVPDGVGGRFTVLSAVGLFSAAMCRIDIDLLLEGARDMDTRVKCEDFYKNPAAINAAINYHFYNHGKKISVMMPYSYALKDLSDWYRQLWAESLGKVKDLAGNDVHIGPTPVKALGATDQHSQVQLYREGPNDKLFTFLQVNNFEKDIKTGPAPDCAEELGFLAGKNLSVLLNNEKKATEYALLTDKRPCLTVIFDKVNAYTIGQFIYLFEVTTSFVGALFNINPYDQPAVELGKEATFALMDKPGDYEAGYTYQEFAKKIHSLTEIDEMFLI